MAGSGKKAEQYQQQGRVQPLAARPAQTPPIDEDEEQVEHSIKVTSMRGESAVSGLNSTVQSPGTTGSSTCMHNNRIFRRLVS